MLLPEPSTSSSLEAVSLDPSTATACLPPHRTDLPGGRWQSNKAPCVRRCSGWSIRGSSTLSGAPAKAIAAPGLHLDRDGAEKRSSARRPTLGAPGLGDDYGSGGEGRCRMIRKTLRSLLRRNEFEDGLDAELQHHIELRTADLMRSGLPRLLPSARPASNSVPANATKTKPEPPSVSAGSTTLATTSATVSVACSAAPASHYRDPLHGARRRCEHGCLQHREFPVAPSAPRCLT